MINQSFHSVQQFLAMGGFADYVWSAYAVTSVVLIWMAGSSWLQHRKIVKKSQEKQAVKIKTSRKQHESN